MKNNKLIYFVKKLINIKIKCYAICLFLLILLTGCSSIIQNDSTYYQKSWKLKNGACIACDPLLKDNILYLCSGDGEITALDLKSGKEKWSFSTGYKNGYSKIYLDFNTLICLRRKPFFEDRSRTTYIFAIDTSSGKLKWKEEFNGIFDIKVKYGLFYFSDTNRIFAYNTENGRKVWEFNYKNEVKYLSNIFNNIICIATSDKLSVMDASTGVLKWEKCIPGITKVPVLSNNRVFWVNELSIHSADLLKGHEKWIFKAQDYIGFFTVNQNLIYFSSNFSFSALSSDTGKQKWSIKICGKNISGAALSKDIAYLSTINYDDNSNKIMAVKVSNGELLWKNKVPRIATRTIMPDNRLFKNKNSIYFIDNSVFAFDKNTGQLLWSWYLKDPTRPFFYDGKLYIGQKSKRLAEKEALSCISENNFPIRFSSPEGSNKFFGIISNDSVFLGSKSNIWLINPNSRKLIWEYKHKRNTLYYPIKTVTVNNQLITVDDSSDILALDTADGDIKWDFVPDNSYHDIDQNIESQKTTLPNDAYFINSGNKLYSINSVSGKENWVYKIKGYYRNSILKIESKTAYIYNLNQLTAVNLITGKELWKVDFECDVIQLTVFKKIIYLATSKKKLYRIKSDSGVIEWHKSIEGNVKSKITAAENTLYFTVVKQIKNDTQISDNTYISFNAVDVLTGNNVWKVEQGNRLFKKSDISVTQPVINDDTVYFGFIGELYAFNVKNGKQKWRFKAIGTEIEFPPIINMGVLFTANTSIDTFCNSCIYALDNNTGKELWRFEVNWEEFILQPILKNNKLYIVTNKNLYVFDLGKITFKY